MLWRSVVCVSFGLAVASAQAESLKQSEPSPPAQAPWLNRALAPDPRAKALLAAMTLDEKVSLVHARFGTPFQGRPKPDGALNSAGFGPGVPRLGIPPLQETDAGLGVANPVNLPYDVTAMPSGLALGASFDPVLAKTNGATIGAEAKAMGFSVMLAGGANLTRDPRNGRNFEYIGEDPLLTGVMAGSVVAGIQSQGIISTVKHFAVNAQETGRVMLSSEIAEQAARESDLLAFEIALETGKPFSVMTGYNRVNGAFASESPFLLTQVLKQDWHYGGWVMSDWGGTHSTEAAALAGLDQESGDNLDPGPYFADPLKEAITAGRVPMARLDDMVFRLLRAEIRAGILDQPPKPGGAIDKAAHTAVAEDVARRGMVLLKNDGAVLPLKHDSRRVLVVGEHADFGVLSGGGSSQVVPVGSMRMPGDPPGRFFGKPKLYVPSSPLRAVQAELPEATVVFLDGHDAVATAEAAKTADVVLVFAEQWMNESRDAPTLTLPKNQDAMITAVSRVNKRVVVVLETGGPVTMPWLADVPAVVEAWYPGIRGAEVITALLFGKADFSGRLPITFPRADAQLPRPAALDGDAYTGNPGEALKGQMFKVDYNIEGPDVGYRWFARTKSAPLFPFGYGLSYTHFTHGPPRVTAKRGILTVRVDVTNAGDRQGTDTPQLYLDSDAGLFTRRLVGWSRVTLKPGETRRVSMTVDPRLLARYRPRDHCWRIEKGRYTLAVRSDATGPGPSHHVNLAARDLAP